MYEGSNGKGKVPYHAVETGLYDIDAEGKRSGITVPRGFLAAGVHCGIKKEKPDLAVLCSEAACVAAGVFTRNKVKAAPVLVTRERVESEAPLRAVVVNSGNANACTGRKGMEDALEMTKVTALHLGLEPLQVAVASTGVIGVPLPMDRVREGIAAACRSLSPFGGGAAASAIMTTDTVPKEYAVSFGVAGTGYHEDVKVCIGGMAKGSGMIRPDLATMLCFLTTDAVITGEALDKALRSAVDRSFNMIAVDNDTSTNDMVLIMANGAAQNPVIECGTSEYEEFERRLTGVCIHLAKWLVRDGEGATKFIEVRVRGAADYRDAKSAAFAVACSDLVKTAMFGEDPNWGRVVAAVGYSEAFVDPERIGVIIGPVRVVENGVATGYREESAKEALSGRDVSIVVDLNVGSAEAVVWTCDLSYDYVKINGSYRS